MLQNSMAKKIPVILALIFLLAAVFSRGNSFSNTASAPFIGDSKAAFSADERSTQDPILTAISASAATPDEPALPDSSSEQAAQPQTTAPPLVGDPVTEGYPSADIQNEPVVETVPATDKYVTLHLDAADISRGNLILVNYENSFDIPEDGDNVNIKSVKSASYRVSDETMLLSASIIEPLNSMMDAFYEESGRDAVTIRSAYRDYNLQQYIYNEYTRLVGPGAAAKWASLPGHSEHHTGMAFDLGIFSDGELRVFTNTGVYSWFLKNSWQYGFIQRYPDGKTEITKTVDEPWHFRYVGEPHAYIMLQNGWCFEEYIAMLRQNTQDDPFVYEYNGVTYTIFSTTSADITVPANCVCAVSGDNIDGFIVTLAG